MKIIGIIILLSFSLTICGQNNNCNQAFIGGKPKTTIPNDVCIPTNYHIREIKQREDVNMDGLKDYIFTYSKVNLADGDTMFLAIYLMQPDSSYVLQRIFNNLYPIVFKDYG